MGLSFCAGSRLVNSMCCSHMACPDQDDVAMEMSIDGEVFAEDQDHVASEMIAYRRPVHKIIDCSVPGSASLRQRKQKGHQQQVRRQALRIKSLELQVVEQSKLVMGMRADDKPHAGMGLALLRNVANGSHRLMSTLGSLSFGNGKSFSPSSMARWEITASNCILADAGEFHVRHELHFREMCDRMPSQWFCAGHGLRGDATKERGWKGNKIQMLQVESTYLDCCGSCPEIVTKSVWPDAVTVVDESSRGCMDTVHHQCRMVRCPALDASSASFRSFAPEVSRFIRFICVSGDNGSDQVGMRSLLSALHEKSLDVLVFGFPCYSHQQSLASCRVMGTVDCISKDWHWSQTYFSIVAKVANVFRCYCFDIHRAAKKIGGAGSAIHEITKKKCKKCIATRWDYEFQVEQYLLEFQGMELRDTIREATKRSVDRDARETAKASVASANKPVDEDQINDTAAFIERRSKWVRESVKGVSNPDFLTLMRISYEAKKPWHHLLCFIQKANINGEKENGHRAVKPPQVDPCFAKTHLSRLVTGKAKTVADEFHSAIFDAEVVWADRATHLVGVFEDQYYMAVASALLKSAAEYHFRLLDFFDSYPYKLMYLCEARFDVRCDDRASIARELLSMDVEDLDQGSAKLRLLMADDLAHCSETGKLNESAWRCICVFRNKAWANIQICESINNIIVHMGTLAPNATRPLLASRCTIKTTLNQAGCRNETVGASDQDAVLGLLDKCLASYKSNEFKDIKHHTGRWINSGVGGPSLLPLALPELGVPESRAPLGAIAAPPAPPAGPAGAPAGMPVDPAEDLPADDSGHAPGCAPGHDTPGAEAAPGVAADAAEDPAGWPAGGLGGEDSTPWLRCRNRLLSNSLPWGLTHHDIASSAKYALWWAYTVPALLSQCFWFSGVDDVLPATGTMVGFLNLEHSSNNQKRLVSRVAS